MRSTSPGPGSVVFYGNGIGDAIINRPTLSALGTHLPRPVRLICNSGRGDFLWRGLPYEEVTTIPMDPNEHDVRLWDLSLIPSSYDDCEVFATLVPWFSPSLDALVARLAPARSYGMGSGFDVCVPLDYSRNSVELGFEVVRAAVGSRDIGSYRAPLPFDHACDESVDRLFRVLKDRGHRRIISLHSETLPSKQWSPDNFGRVLCAVLERHPDAVVVIVDYRPPQIACPCHAHRVVSLTGLHLQHAMRIVTWSDLFFGVDSCMLHAADFAGVPGVVLFGPQTEPHEFGYYWTKADHLRFSGYGDDRPTGEAIEAISRQLDQLSGAQPLRAHDQQVA